jgi:hypothetical protein
MSSNEEDLLTRFQRQADVEALITYGQGHGYAESRLRPVVDSLRPIFETLSLGLEPDYNSVSREDLLQFEPETVFVVRSMAGSEAADLKAAGFHLMAVLDLEPFVEDLRQATASPHQWERIEAIHALGRMSQPQVRAILESAMNHSDPLTSEAARNAIQSFNPRERR